MSDEPDANGRILLRPKVPFRTRGAALEQMARVVRDAPPVTRPRRELIWVAEPPGQDIWQAPDETEQLGTGDCEDLEMYAARQDLDAGVRDIALCMSVTGRRNEHVFGLRGGVVVDHSEQAGMPPLSPSVYARRVCVPVLHEEGERTMIMGYEGATGGPTDVAEDARPYGISTGGDPQDNFDDYNIHGIAHWRSHAWDRAAASAAHRFPNGRPQYVRVIPGLKSAASYFSTIHLNAWDQAGNDARLHKVSDAVWVSKRGEELAHAAYLHDGGEDADFVLDFERRYGRPPTDRESVRAAVRALVFISTAKTHPGYQKRLAQMLSRAPRTLTQAAIQVAVIAQGLVPPDAFPVPPHCPECLGRRKQGFARVVEPEDINLKVVYNTQTTNTVAAAPGSVATTNATSASAPGAIAAPVTGAPPALSLPGLPTAVAPVVAPVVTAAAPAAGVSMPPMFAGLFGGNPFAAAAAALAPPPVVAAPAPSFVGPTAITNSGNVSNSGNVTLNITEDEDEGAGDVIADDGSGTAGMAGMVGGQPSDIESVMGMMASGAGSDVLGALGLTTGGPSAMDDEFSTGGLDDELTTGGYDDDFGGSADDEGFVDVSGWEDEGENPGIDLMGAGDALGGMFGDSTGDIAGELFGGDDSGGDGEAFVAVDESCETGECGLF